MRKSQFKNVSGRSHGSQWQDERGSSVFWFYRRLWIHPASKFCLLLFFFFFSFWWMWEHPDQSRKVGLDGPSCEKLLTYPQLALRYAFKNWEDLPTPIWIFLQKSALLLTPSSLLWIKMASIFSWEKKSILKSLCRQRNRVFLAKNKKGKV